MSEISNFWLSVSIYLVFILVSKSTHPVSLVLYSQNALNDFTYLLHYHPGLAISAILCAVRINCETRFSTSGRLTVSAVKYFVQELRDNK